MILMNDDYPHFNYYLGAILIILLGSDGRSWGGGVTSHIMTAASRHFQSYPDKQIILGYPKRWLILSLVTTTTKLSTAVNSDRTFTLAYQFDN